MACSSLSMYHAATGTRTVSRGAFFNGFRWVGKMNVPNVGWLKTVVLGLLGLLASVNVLATCSVYCPPPPVVTPSEPPPTLEGLALSKPTLQAGVFPDDVVTVKPVPSSVTLPACTISRQPGQPELSRVFASSTLEAKISQTPDANKLAEDTVQTVTCGTVSTTFTVKPRAFGPPDLLTLAGATSIQSGARTFLTATARYADGRERTVNPAWTSSDPVVASVGSTGAVAAGVVTTATPVTITGSLTEGGKTVQSSHVITVLPNSTVLTSLTLNGASTVQSAGQIRLVANAVYADSSSKAVSASLTVSNPALGSVDNRGVFTAASVSNDAVVTVNASYQEGGVTKIASLSITISAARAKLSRLTLVGTTTVLSSGQSLNLSALGVYSDTSSKPVVPIWRVSSSAATVSSAGLFQASSVSVDTPVVVSASYSEAGVTVDAQIQIIIQAAVPTSPIQAEVLATGPSTSFSLAVWTSFSELSQSAVSTRTAAPRSGRPVYKLFVISLVPGGKLVPVATVLTLNRNSEWQALSFPVVEYLNGVAENSVQLVEILDKVDVSLISGTKFFVGYGTDDLEMIQSGRFRLVYQIQ